MPGQAGHDGKGKPGMTFYGLVFEVGWGNLFGLWLQNFISAVIAAMSSTRWLTLRLWWCVAEK